MNICVLASSYPAHALDLAGPFVPHLVRALERRGHRVVVLTQAKPAPRDAAGLDVRWFDWWGSGRPLVQLRPWRPGDALALASWLRGAAAAIGDVRAHQRIDVCLALMALPAGLVAWWARQRLGLPYVVWALGSDVAVWGRRRFARPVLRAVLRAAAGHFANSVQLATQAAALAGQPFLFLPTLRPLPAPAAVPLPAQHRHVLFVGRLEHVKGPDVLLHAWAQFRSVRPDVLLHLVGGGTLATPLRSLAERLGVSETVVWHGVAHAAQIAGFLAQADVVAIPSRSESIPVVFSEALQMGAPLAVTDVGDMGTLVRLHGVGLVVPPEDPRALARALGGVLAAGRSAYQERIAAARALFDLDAVADRLEAALVAAAEGHGRQPEASPGGSSTSRERAGRPDGERP